MLINVLFIIMMIHTYKFQFFFGENLESNLEWFFSIFHWYNVVIITTKQRFDR